MKYQNLIYEKEGNIVWITLNRPEKLNAVNDVMVRELDAALDEVERDLDIRVVIFKGAGRSFCVGQDISGVGTSEVMPPDPKTKPYLTQLYEADQRDMTRLRRILDFPRYTIAMVHGYCLAWGCYLAMACRYSIVAEDAVFGDPSVRMGLTSPSPLWTWRVGPKKAKELLLTGKYIDGKEAVRIGLITMAVPQERLEEEVRLAAETKVIGAPIGGMDGDRGFCIFHDAATVATIAPAWEFTAYLHALSAIQKRGFAPGEFNFWEAMEKKGLNGAIEERDAPFRKLYPYGLKGG